MNAVSPVTIWLIAAQDVDKIWPQVEPFLAKAIDRGNVHYSIRDLYTKLVNRDWALVVSEQSGSIRSACVCCFNEDDAGLWLRIILCGGTNMVQWLDKGMVFLEKYAKHQGCKGIEIIGRPEWARVLGYRKRSVIMEKVF